eukprot:CCRYP_003983-RA/>CCRYP_003983-RA protein AED:0.02 eAED:0.02 QI:175/1/1/1/1/1/4/1132/1292
MTPSKRRRRHEMASWWMLIPAHRSAVQHTLELNNEASNGKDSIIMDEVPRNNKSCVPSRESMTIHSLKEGENWLVIQNQNGATSEDVDQLQISIVHDPNCFSVFDNGEFFGICSGGDENDPKEGKIEINNNNNRDQHHDNSKNCLLQSLPLLCIDVDSAAQCIAVKDVRRGKSHVIETIKDPNSSSNKQDNSNVADRFEFSLHRKKTHDKQVQKLDGMDHANREPVPRTEQDKPDSESHDAHSSGYTTDDEKDDLDDVEERRTSKKNRDIGTQVDNDLPPEETDVDLEGNSLYEPPEWLPPRQLRVLKDGDRLVMRYTPCSMTTDNDPKNCDMHSCPTRIAKLEYIYHSRRSKNAQHPRMKEMKGTMVDTTPGKPRLLSVKSDVKSECKKKFTLNSTSAAEAPSDDDVSIKATKGHEHHGQRKREHSGNARAGRGAGAVHDYFCKKSYDNHKAGKDWSADESVRADAVGARGGGNKNDKNASRNNNDDDDGMEEYSYLTGEIVMKDQDYISALTGDEAIVPPSGQQLNSFEGQRGKSGNDDAATATNVAVGGSSSPAAKSKRDGQFKEVSFDAKCRTPEKAPPNNPIGNDDCVEPIDNDNGQKSKEEAFQTARSNHEDEHRHSGDEELELLSQAGAGSSPEKGARNYDDVTDVSQTQSLPFIKTAIKYTDECSHSLSDVDEGKEEDDSTTGPESPNKEGGVGIDNGMWPSHVEVKNTNQAFNQDGDNHFCQSTSFSPKFNNQYDEEAYNAETQFVGAPSPSALSYNSDHEIYNAETQFVALSTQENMHLSEDAKIDDANVDGAVINSEKQPLKTAEVPLRSNEATDHRLSHEKSDPVKQPEAMISSESPRANVVAGNIESSPTLTKPSSPMRATYENSRLLGDDAIHRIQNGAMMTGSVGGTNLGMSVARGNTDRDLLTSIALQSTPNTLPEAPMSSEETTVVNDRGTKDNNHLLPNSDGKRSGAKEQKNSSQLKKGSTDFIRSTPVNDIKYKNDKPTIPSEVCFVEKEIERINIRKMSRKSFTPSRQRSKRICQEDTKLSTDNHEQIRIMFTGIEISSKHRRMIQSIGAEVVESLENAASATHVIASDGNSKLRRTPKLMICICKTSNILSIDWLEQSASQNKVLDPKGFLVLGDKAAEAAYNFSMRDTLENGEEARRNGGVLGGYYVYICNGVADNNAPPLQALQLIIEAAGGQVLKTLARRGDTLNTIILTSDPSTNAQLTEKGVKRAGSQGAKIRTTSWLFHTIITQRISVDAGFSHSPLEKPKSASKRKFEAISPSSSTKRRKSGRR